MRLAEDWIAKHVYLLDETLGLDTIGNISPNLEGKILGNVTEISYRDVAETVSAMTNQSISHQRVWNVVQAVGEKRERAL